MTSTTEKRQIEGLRGYIEQVGDLPTDVLLGRIVLFTITDHGVPTQDCLDVIDTLALGSIAKPQVNKYVDAFKKATSDVKDSYPMTKSRTGHLLCRDVTSTGDFIRRQITREIKDGGKKRLRYDPAIEVTFYRPSDSAQQATAKLKVTVNKNVLEAGEVEMAMAVAEGISANYERYYRTFDGMKIRAWVRAYLKKLNSVEIKGGVYFVPVSRDEELSRLAEFVKQMGGGCRMNMIPMVNLEREREFITEIFEREAAESLREITDEVAEILSTRKGVSAKAYANIKARYDEVLANATEHMDNLQITQDLTAASAEVAFESLQKLVNAMLEDGVE